MRSFIAFRHGRCMGQATKGLVPLDGETDIEPSESASIKTLAQSLSKYAPQLIFSSTLRRSRTTAAVFRSEIQSINPQEVSGISVSPLFDEWFSPKVSGLPLDATEYEGWKSQRHSLKWTVPDGGEAPELFIKRVQTCLALMREITQTKRIVVVTHQLVLAVMNQLLWYPTQSPQVAFHEATSKRYHWLTPYLVSIDGLELINEETS